MAAKTQTQSDQARRNISMSRLDEAILALAPNDLTMNRLPSALAELGAARGESDSAVMQILDAADALMAIAADLGGSRGVSVITATDLILQACSMNDIVGQRLAKAAGVILEARNRLAALTDVIGSTDEVRFETVDDARIREQLTFGPALTQTMNQSDVDEFFSI